MAKKKKMQRSRVLVVDDEASIRQMIRFALERADFDVSEAGDTAEARIKVADETPDLMVLDWMMPGQSGVDLARSLRKDGDTSDLPIIMLTARTEEDDRIRGLEVGADDYVTKPFSPRELVARIQAVLRRATPEDEEDELVAEGLIIDLVSHRVTANGDSVALGPTEFRLLSFFMSNPERVYSRTQLLDNVWGRNVYVEERTVDVHIRRLRKVLENHGYERFVQTVRGAGYRFSTKA